MNRSVSVGRKKTSVHFKPGGTTARNAKLKPGLCKKFKAMMGFYGKKFSHRCKACMFFEDRNA